jgi:hypothetical protein
MSASSTSATGDDRGPYEPTAAVAAPPAESPAVAADPGPLARAAARGGYAALGILYAAVGVLAVVAAVDRRARAADLNGALATMRDGWGGRVLSGMVITGLAGYVLWLLADAALDLHHAGRGWRGWVRRVGSLVIGLAYLAMIYWAARVLKSGRTFGDAGGDGAAHDWTAAAMGWPGGRWAVGAAGVGTAVYGLYELYSAWRARLDARLDLCDLSATARRCAVHVSRFGMAARGWVLTLVGGFLVQAAYRHDPSAARGLGGALGALRARPSGPWLLAVAGLGLVAYGVYNFALAAFRRLHRQPPPRPGAS